MGVNRNYGLDLVRAVAITLVFTNHLVGNFITNHQGSLWYLAHLGVDLFFALSGFLIGTILIKMADEAGGKLSLKASLRFLSRRWYRTVPLYYLVLLVVFMLERYVYHSIDSFNWKYLFWMQYTYGAKTSFFGESWSLCVEEWFYVTFSLGFCLFSSALHKTRFLLQHKLLFFTILYIAAVTVIRYVFSDHNYLTYRLTIFRLDSIAYGVLLAIINYYYAAYFLKQKHVITIASLILTIIGIWLFLKNYYINLYYNFTGLGLASLVYIISLSYKQKVSKLNGISFISKISYSIYLLNLNVIMILVFIGSNFSSIILLVAAIIFTILLSLFTYRYIETYFLKLRDRSIKSDEEKLTEALPSLIDVRN